jgi:hypothetical protein
MECPACGSYGSSVLQAFVDGDDCPRCRLPAQAAEQVINARKQHVSAELVDQYTRSILAKQEAERRARLAEHRLREVEQALQSTPYGWEDTP